MTCSICLVVSSKTPFVEELASDTTLTKRLQDLLIFPYFLWLCSEKPLQRKYISPHLFLFSFDVWLIADILHICITKPLHLWKYYRISWFIFLIRKKISCKKKSKNDACSTTQTHKSHNAPWFWITHNGSVAPYGVTELCQPWWRHQMETFSALLAICAGNSSVPDEFPTQRPVTQSFDVLFALHPNKRLSKHWWDWWFDTLSRPLWRHCKGYFKLWIVSWQNQAFTWINVG